MKRLMLWLSRGRLQLVLIAAFAAVAALTVGLNTLVTSRAINSYLANAETERVARDMKLADALYQLKQDDIAAISHRLVLDPALVASMPAATQGQAQAKAIIDQEITNKITVLALQGTHLIAVLDGDGNILAGRVLPQGKPSLALSGGDWGELPIVKKVLSSGDEQSGTEVIPAEFLAQVGLEKQAQVTLVNTPKAASAPFDAREGTAGLALTGVYPLLKDGKLVGTVVAAYLFNNDFALVDHIKEVAGIDTVTVFFGDLRVSTNVMTEQEQRAVGTRISQDVGHIVLEQGQDYTGRAYVVNAWYITRYTPLRNHQGAVVGSLYVGAPESLFLSLIVFSNLVVVIALLSVALAGVVAIPIARFITRPVVHLVDAHRRLAQGDMTVRVEPHGTYELVTLGNSFNTMAETLRNVQDELLHKEKLASVGQLAAGVAHEINNPLGTILLFAGLLTKDLAQDDSKRGDVDMIVKEATRCKNIVADLLNFARQQEIFSQDTDVNELLEQVLAQQSLRPNFAQIEIVRQLDPGLPIIQADTAQLQQVFINLMDNAAEAMEKGGALTIATRRLDANSIEIQVSDTGCGIPEENLGKLFNPFFTTKPPGKGTGLGLSIVYGIVKMHRGQITVQSQVGQGATFRVILPIRLKQDKTAANAAQVIG